MTSKTCKNCGATNDLLFDTCQFCKTALDKTDINSISTEELLLNAGEWIGKLKEGRFVVQGPNYSSGWTVKDVRVYEKAEIQGYANKYLTLLHVRAISNQSIQMIVNNLQNQYQDGAASDDALTKSMNSSMTMIGKTLIGAFLVIGLMMILMSKCS